MKLLIIISCTAFFLSCTRSPRFQLLNSEQTGIGFNNTVAETDSFNILTYEYMYNGAGVGIGDLNNDGLQDIIFAGNRVSPRIYLNSGGFRFKDITANFKGITNDQWYSGVTVADINSDSWLDVYFTAAAGSNPQQRKNRLWINEGIKAGGDPVFIEKAGEYGIADEGHSVQAAFFDYDLDGDLDLYVLNNLYGTNEFFNQQMPAVYRQKITDGSAANNDKLYRNNGNGTFTDVTIEAGIVFEGYGLGLALGDVNKDGYPDIYVSNDYIANDLLYINQGNGTFRNEIGKYMSYQTKSSMGNDMADVNNDGNPDMYTLDMLPESNYKRKQTINGFGYIYYINDAKYGYEHQYIRNMFHLHNGFINGKMIPYSEVGQFMGIHATEWSWSPLFADYDNDGDKDLIITNGYPRDLTDKDWTFYKMKTLNIFNSPQQVIDAAPVIKIPNMAFENTGNLRFVKRTREWLPDIPSFSNGAAFADLDNDGDLDYVVNNVNDEAFILRNFSVERSEKKARFIKIRLTGKPGNTMAIGTKVELWSKGNYQYAEHFLSRGYASSVDPVIHFGLSQEAVIDSIKITWPAGTNTTLVTHIATNQTIELDESDSRTATNTTKSTGTNLQLFSRSDSVIDYLHEQSDFIDFFYYQMIIPHKFSQIGPVMAKGDLNHDGVDDLIIGSTNTLPTTVMLRNGEVFRKSEFAGLTTLKEVVESDLTVVDIDSDGDNDVVAVAGGYENPEEGEYHHYLYENRNDTFTRSDLPVPSFPASVIRTIDFDHDGDMDIFVGSRVKKGKFPFADPSWLIINDKGRLTVKPFSGLDLGMVTDAVWSDYDQDGWEDLLVAREWNSIAILRNMNGKELVLQNLPDTRDYHGIWYSLCAGDFDNDGDDDYLAGNLGDNHRFTVTDRYPLNLYAIDLDLDGKTDPLTTAFWKDQHGKMKEYPVNYLDELAAQSAFFRSTFTDYNSFSKTGIDDILDEEILKNLELKLYVNTTSSYVIWNEKGKLRWERLPLPVQLSPVKKMLVQDFNADGYPDVLVAGNDYTYDIATGYYDANKGLVLLSEGNRKLFEVLTPPQSGIMLQGMTESLQYFDGEFPLVVAGINRARIEVFKHLTKKR